MQTTIEPTIAEAAIEPTQITVAMPRDNDKQFQRALAEAAVANDYVIDSQDMYEYAAHQLTVYKQQAEALEARRTAITGPMNVALRNVNALFKPVSEKLEEASRLLRSRMLEWTRREQQRIAAENAERERQARVLREELEARAKAAAQGGRAEEAFALSQSIDVMSAPVQPVQPAKVQGVSTRQVWTAECTDLHALVAYVAAHPEYLNLLQINQTALTALAKAQKKALAIPGVRAFDKGTVAVRG
ncbi:hypothetical protein AB3X94_37435 [Paraburkholderia sp. BR10923]|uniref:hypothetical protein n=1 Tax=Paraburkholderia sp. BR10923 TaxID=3236992 RepID=UPI0034CF0779